MDKSYRIHTNIAEDTLLQVDMRQDFDFLEVLSLKLRQKDAYRLHSSNYGVIIGRVLANDAFGIPNAKLSIFIERDDSDSSDMEFIYPYKEVTSKDREGRRYNILPDYSDDDCYRVVGTFPNKRLMLDNDTYLDVYEKYWKYTTVTNNAGDYMIFGVPTGSVTVHVDIDLSDIGVLSQKPRDFEYKGYNLSMFDSPVQFKESTNLDNLAQLLSQNRSVFVYPFWGDADNGVAAITRADIQVQYKFEPTCVFMGSIVSDNESHAIGHKCAPDIENGMNDQLVGGSGTIEMIRKTTDGLVEEYQIQGNQLIDENGVWCYQIPMNLDYIGTDEYGNIVPTDNPNKGIPTRAQVRFRISKNETSDEGFSRHTAKYLVPMNPIFSEKNDLVKLNDGSIQTCGTIPFIADSGAEIERMYTFGSSTPLHCFRDLYWNNVYSVKNYIPKSQVAHRAYAKNYTGLKGSNLAEDQNPIPFNKLRIDLPFVYMVVCLLFTIVTYIIWFINYFIICTIDDVLSIFWRIKKLKILRIRPFKWLPVPDFLGCIVLSAGISEGNVAYYPGCRCRDGLDASDCPKDMEGSCRKSTDVDELLDKIQRNLAQEFKIVKLDLYQDWVNGCLYMPLWYWRKRKKKTFLFFTLSRAKNEYCSDSSLYSRLKTYVTCNIRYHDRDFTVSDNKRSMPDSESRWHKNRAAQVRYERGLIKPVENKDGLTAYYYVAVQATSDNANSDIEMVRREPNFKAVRLFATDIILLGNLDPDNIYGIPQFFKCLPSTTANVPPIATIEEIINPDEKEAVYDKDTSGNAEDSGNTITTGMDWNHDGEKKSPKYKTGLFIDLACTYASTKPKSCINVERISELGVSLDMTHNMAYHEGGNTTQYGEIENDGFITKYELDDMENRAMFATLNHIGFIPQEYQDMHDFYTTQVLDRNTNYLIPKFKYIYPVDFDGRMQVPMDLYKNGFDQATFDEKDESYITFKMGAEMSEKLNNNSEQRIRHFYRYEDKMYDMPLYNNSYYFYFGIKKGSTAIDKFNEMFDASCFKNDKKPFELVIETQGKSYCPEAYTTTECRCPSSSAVTEETLSGSCRYKTTDNRNKAYGRIRVTSDDIRIPYSYRLSDMSDTVIVEEEGMTVSSFVIGGQIDENGRTVSNCNGWIFKQVPNDDDKYERIEEDLEPYYSYGLTNQEYVLEVTDADGRTITEKIKLDIPKITATYKSTHLGTKFYNSASTRIDYICHDDNAFYGKIEMTEFSVDGYNCEIQDVECLGYDPTKDRYRFCITGKSDDISSNVVALLDLRVLKTSEENKVRNCLCDDNDDRNLIKKAQNEQLTVKMKITPESNGVIKNDYFLALIPETEDNANKRKIILYVYQPNQYVAKITQSCAGDCSNPIIDNTSEETITIQNGSPFITKLNTMPTRFMLGSSTDTNDGKIANTSYFYRTSSVTNEMDYHIKGWYGVHQEDSYMFSRRDENKTYNYNQYMWEDFFTNTTDDVASPGMKRAILKFKFDTMFKLSEATYVTTDSTCKFDFEATGGVSPILYRTLAPMYEDSDKAMSRYVLNDFFQTKGNQDIPNIVATNYSLPEERGKNNHKDKYPKFIIEQPYFNDGFYSNATLIGNYFAAFTRNGSYISKTQIDGKKIQIERSPAFASISPCNFLKPIGKDATGSINTFPYVYNEGNQRLDGDEMRHVLPYLRALYVDRRLDYDLTVLAPVKGNNFSLHSNVNKNRIWKSGRISGWTYNGIEMSYDENYNIISADTHSASTTSYQPTGEDLYGVGDIEYSAATFNKRLEYTYKYDSAHVCLTCGLHFDKYLECEGGIKQCPVCHSTNIKLFHGEKVNVSPIANKTISVYNVCTEATEIAPVHEVTTHKLDTVNFNNFATTIPGIVARGNESAYTLDDAVTYYHKWTGDWNCDWKPNEMRWGKWNIVKNASGETFGADPDEFDPETGELKYAGYDRELPTVPLIKQFFSSTIANYDIRHLYWSLFNHNRLRYYTSINKNYTKKNQQLNGYGIDAIENPHNPFYVYHYPGLDAFSADIKTYNGDFNRDDVVQNNDTNRGRIKQTNKIPYQTRRFIDIGNLPAISQYMYDISSCSYAMKSYITDDGRIMAETDGGESVELNFNWTTPISIITPNDSSDKYANITYRPHSTKDGYIHFYATTGSIKFKINPYTCDGFEVYTKTPRLIQVLPYIHPKNDRDREIDGIGYYKTANPSDNVEFGGRFGDGKSLDDAINDITLENGVFKSTTFNPFTARTIDIFPPEGVDTGNGYTTKEGFQVNGLFFRKDDEWLTSDNDDFNNIIFSKNAVDLTNNSTNATARVFTVLIDREYRYEEDDNLVRHIRTIETSDLFDCRTLYMKITTSGLTTDSDGRNPGDEWYVETKGDLTYVEMRQSATEVISGLNASSVSVTTTDISGTSAVGEIDKHDTELGENNTKLYMQTVTFDMRFNTSEDVSNRQNESFADYDMMSYTFRFRDTHGESHDVTPSNVYMFESGDYILILRFVLKWPVDMGILADPLWTGSGMNGSVPVEVYARAASGFIYKLTNFRMRFGCGQYTEGGCKRSTKVEEEIKKPMNPSPNSSGEKITYLTDIGLVQ